jgi:hypothetical protein
MIRVNEKWVILIDGDRLTVAEDLGHTQKLRAADGSIVEIPRYIVKQSYSTLTAAINGVCSYMTIRELADNNYTLAEALQVTHDLYTMVNDSIREVLKG